MRVRVNTQSKAQDIDLSKRYKVISKRQKKKEKAIKKKKLRKQEKLLKLKKEKNEKKQMIKKVIETEGIRKGKKGRVILRNLIVDINERLLRKLLSKFGTILEIQIPVNPENNLSRGFAFVEFSSQFEAIEAIRELHDTMYKGRKITVNFSVDKRMYNNGGQSEQESKMIDLETQEVGGIPIQEEPKEENIVQEIEENPEEAKSEEFLEIEGESVKSEEPEEEEEKKEVEVEEKKEEDMSCTIFLRNVDYESTEEDIQKRFSKWGKVRYVRLVYDTLGDNSCHKGVGFVKFAEASVAQKLIDISRQLDEDPLKADELDPNNWLEFNTKQIKILPAMKREKLVKMQETQNQKVDLSKIKKTSALKIVTLDPKDMRNMSLAKLGLPIFENNLKIFMKLKGKTMGEKTKGMEKTQLKWRENHLTEKVTKMRNPNYKINPKRIVLKGISKSLTHDQIRRHLILILNEEGYVPEKLKQRLAGKEGKEVKVTVKHLQTVKLFKQVKVMRDPQKKNRSKGIVFVEFMDRAAAEIYMKAIKEVEYYSVLQNEKGFLPIVEFTFMDMRTEKKMKGIKEKMRKNAQSNDPKFKLVNDFKKKVKDSKETPKKTISEEEKLKLRKQKAQELAVKCFTLLNSAIESKDKTKGIEAKKAINRMKSRGKRQRFLKKLYTVFDAKELASSKTKKIKKKPVKAEKKVKKIIKKEPEIKKLDKESKKELDSIFKELEKVEVPTA
jgi:nucleolar protein 4